MIQCQDQFYPFEELFEWNLAVCKLFIRSNLALLTCIFNLVFKVLVRSLF